MKWAFLFGAFALASCGGVSKSELAEAIEKSDTVAHCLNLASAAPLITEKEQFDAGFLDFHPAMYGDIEEQLPPFIKAMVANGVLLKDGIYEKPALFGTMPIVRYKIAKDHENLFRMKVRDNGRRGTVYLCGGDMDVEVVNFTEPAEGQNTTQVQYRFEIVNTPPAFRTMIEGGQIPRVDTAIGGQEVLLSGEGTATVVKMNTGWEVPEARL